MTKWQDDGMSLPEGNRYGPNCGITAVAVAAGIAFDEAWAACRAARIRQGILVTRRWRGRTTIIDRKYALRELGVAWVNEELPGRMTLAAWVRRFSKPGVRYMVRTTGHVQIVKNQRVLDQSHESVTLREYRWSRKFVTHVMRLED